MTGLGPEFAAAVNGPDLAAALEEAETTGSMDVVWQLVDTLVDVSAGASRDLVLATVLFRLAADAGEASPLQQVYLRAMTRHCTEEAIEDATLGSMVSAALLQGWMKADEYDTLAARVDQLTADHQARRAWAMVERRVDPPVAHHVMVTEQAQDDQLWRCCLASSAPRLDDATWVSFDPAAMIDGLHSLVRHRLMHPDRPRPKLRVVFDSPAIAAAVEGNNCHWLVHAAWLCEQLDVRVELVHYGLADVPPIVNDRISLLVNTLMEMRRGEVRAVPTLDVAQLDYVSVVLQAGRNKWPALVASHAGAALAEQHRHRRPRKT